MVNNIMEYLHKAGISGERPVGATRLNLARDFAFASRLCLASVDRLSGMMGVTDQIGRNVVQGYCRDCRTMSTHRSLQWDKCMSPTGKLLFGLNTGDPFVDNEAND